MDAWMEVLDDAGVDPYPKSRREGLRGHPGMCSKSLKRDEPHRTSRSIRMVRIVRFSTASRAQLDRAVRRAPVENGRCESDALLREVGGQCCGFALVPHRGCGLSPQHASKGQTAGERLCRDDSTGSPASPLAKRSMTQNPTVADQWPEVRVPFPSGFCIPCAESRVQNLGAR